MQGEISVGKGGEHKGPSDLSQFTTEQIRVPYKGNHVVTYDWKKSPLEEKSLSLANKTKEPLLSNSSEKLAGRASEPSDFKEAIKVQEAAWEAINLEGDSEFEEISLIDPVGVKFDSFKARTGQDYEGFSYISDETKQLVVKAAGSKVKTSLKSGLQKLQEDTNQFKRDYGLYGEAYQKLVNPAEIKALDKILSKYEPNLQKIPAEHEKDSRFGEIVKQYNKAIDSLAKVNETALKTRPQVVELAKEYCKDLSSKISENDPKISLEMVKELIEAHKLLNEKINNIKGGSKAYKNELSASKTKLKELNKLLKKASGAALSESKTRKISLFTIVTLDELSGDDSDVKLFNVNPQGLHLDTGKEITYNYQHKGAIYGTDHVTRIDTARNLIKSLKSRIDALGQKIKQNQKNLPLKIACEKQLKFAEKLLENSSRLEKKGWTDSNAFRSQVKDRSTGETYSERASKVALGAPVNLRFQEGKSLQSGKSVGFFRLGVITDLRNGFTHLSEMRDIIRNGGEEKLIDQYEALKMEFNDKPELNQAKIEALQDAIDTLKTQDKLEAAIMEREMIMGEQMLQLVSGQIEKNLDALLKNENQSEFEIVHLALLNHKNNSIDATGWAHYESNEMLDMQQIFKDFEGKKIIFDGLGPFIDPDGNLHMKELIEAQDGKGREISLKPKFINISVQGNEVNEGIQLDINEDKKLGFKSLIEMAEKKIEMNPQNSRYRNALNLLKDSYQQMGTDGQGASTYKIAENVTTSLLMLDMPLSIGCLSAKDRTGYVGARVIANFISDEIDYLNQSKENLKKKFGGEILSSKGSGAKIVQDNTGITVLKCSTFKLPGYTKGIIGKIKRVFYYMRQGLAIF